MKVITKILGTTLILWAVLATVAAATSLAISSTVLAAGNTAVTSCGVASASATRTVDNSGTITGITVANIPTACSGKTLLVTLKGQTGNALASTSNTVSSCAATCTVTLSGYGTVSAANLYGYAFAVTG